MDAIFDINLEHFDGDEHCHIFRLAFESSTDRLLLPYPQVTGLQFTKPTGNKVAEWKTRTTASTPLDDFVLNPDARIAFDLKAHINIEPDLKNRWAIQLPAGPINAHFVFNVDADIERYDFLAKRSRLAAITKPWGGSVRSNLVQFTVTVAGSSPQKTT